MKKFLIQCLISWKSAHNDVWGRFPPTIVLSILLAALILFIPSSILAIWLHLSDGLFILTWVALIVTTPKMYEDAAKFINREIDKFEGADD